MLKLNSPESVQSSNPALHNVPPLILGNENDVIRLASRFYVNKELQNLAKVMIDIKVEHFEGAVANAVRKLDARLVVYSLGQMVKNACEDVGEKALTPDPQKVCTHHGAASSSPSELRQLYPIYISRNPLGLLPSRPQGGGGNLFQLPLRVTAEGNFNCRWILTHELGGGWEHVRADHLQVAMEISVEVSQIAAPATQDGVGAPAGGQGKGTCKPNPAMVKTNSTRPTIWPAATSSSSTAKGETVKTIPPEQAKLSPRTGKTNPQTGKTNLQSGKTIPQTGKTIPQTGEPNPPNVRTVWPKARTVSQNMRSISQNMRSISQNGRSISQNGRSISQKGRSNLRNTATVPDIAATVSHFRVFSPHLDRLFLRFGRRRIIQWRGHRIKEGLSPR